MKQERENMAQQLLRTEEQYNDTLKLRETDHEVEINKLLQELAREWEGHHSELQEMLEQWEKEKAEAEREHEKKLFDMKQKVATMQAQQEEEGMCGFSLSDQHKTAASRQEESHARCSRRLAELQNQVRSRKALVKSCRGCTEGHSFARCYSPSFVWLSGSEYTRQWKYPVSQTHLLAMAKQHHAPRSKSLACLEVRRGGRGIGGSAENWHSPQYREDSKDVPLESYSSC
ncbi:uncharacterized protein LOC142045254 [Buteo buteo]|uniref:uncharacterized protein LOC142045254 n=1 Tax=Buteo buteo TaxID=30397 RepID=UPI003EB88B96